MPYGQVTNCPLSLLCSQILGAGTWAHHCHFRVSGVSTLRAFFGSFMLVSGCLTKKASPCCEVVDLWQVFEAQEKNIKTYLAGVAQDPSRHHRFMRAVESYVEKINAGRKRIRDRDAVRSAAKLSTAHSRGRQLVGRWKQAVPISRWQQCYPSLPVPGPDKLGWEIIDGQKQQCAYVVKDPTVSKPWHFDVEEWEGTSLNTSTTLAEVRSSDSEDAEEILSARKTKAMDTFKAKSSQAESAYTFTAEDLEEDAKKEGAKEGEMPKKEATDQSSDESDDCLEANAFMRALDPLSFGASKSAPAKGGSAAASSKVAAKPAVQEGLLV